MSLYVVDVGATSTKWQFFSADGTASSRPRKRPTPSPCGPDELVARVAARARDHAIHALALGFPGTLRGGVVVDPANLARVGGPGTAVDEDAAAKWRGVDLAAALARELGCRAVVCNDADAAALGCVADPQRHLVVTLGTGFGCSVVAENAVVEIDDVGSERYGDHTVDEVFGEAGRARDERRWRADLSLFLQVLAARFAVDLVHVAGGNARRLSPLDLDGRGVAVQIERDEPALRGLVRLLTESAVD